MEPRSSIHPFTSSITQATFLGIGLAPGDNQDRVSASVNLNCLGLLGPRALPCSPSILEPQAMLSEGCTSRHWHAHMCGCWGVSLPDAASVAPTSFLSLWPWFCLLMYKVWVSKPRLLS